MIRSVSGDAATSNSKPLLRAAPMFVANCTESDVRFACTWMSLQSIQYTARFAVSRPLSQRPLRAELVVLELVRIRAEGNDQIVRIHHARAACEGVDDRRTKAGGDRCIRRERRRRLERCAQLVRRTLSFRLYTRHGRDGRDRYRPREPAQRVGEIRAVITTLREGLRIEPAVAHAARQPETIGEVIAHLAEGGLLVRLRVYVLPLVVLIRQAREPASRQERRRRAIEIIHVVAATEIEAADHPVELAVTGRREAQLFDDGLLVAVRIEAESDRAIEGAGQVDEELLVET